MTREKDADGASAGTLPGGGIETRLHASLDDVLEQAASPAELALVEILAEQIASQGREGVKGSLPDLKTPPGAPAPASGRGGSGSDD